MVESVALLSMRDKNGNPLANTDSGQAELLDRNANHVVYTKFEDTASIGSYACDRNISASTVSISEYTSVCETILVDETKTKLSSYDTLYGINYASYVKGRQFIIIVDQTGVADASLPADGAAYSAENQVVIFSGYNKPGIALDFNALRVHMDWIGVENLLNEVKIFGCYTKNVTTPNWPASGSVGLKVLSNNKCIFNENGRGDLNSENLKSDVGKYYFNKSGMKHSTVWTLEKILRYVVEWYTKVDSELIALDNRLGLNLIAYIGNYIDFDYRDLEISGFADIVPYDFSIEGLGVLEAIQKIIEESKSYCMYKGYCNNGAVTISYQSKYADTTNRGTEVDQPMLIRIGALNDVADGTILYNSANIKLNRETKNIGRVIVAGDFLAINTLATSCAYPQEGSKEAFSGLFSTNKDTYSAIGGLTTFTDRMALVLTDTQRVADINEQRYVAIPTNLMSLTIADVTADLNQYQTASFQEADTTKIFDTLKACKINRFLDQGTITEQSVSRRDVGVYIGHPSDNEVRSPETLEYVYPTIKVASDEFYFITPIENQDVGIEAKIDTDEHGSILIYGNSTDLNEDTGFTNFREYLYKSEMLPFEAAYGFSNYNVTNPAPLWVRANIKTDYRIKGIATISGYDNAIHETMIVYDNDFKLSLNYKDATYNGAGSFSNITNGFINASDNTVLQKLQEKAEAILAKYRVIQNSGYCELNGVQLYFKVGDWIDKFVGSGRNIETPAMVESIIFDFQNKKTTLTFGS